MNLENEGRDKKGYFKRSNSQKRHFMMGIEVSITILDSFGKIEF